jgi:hypothetical protein
MIDKDKEFGAPKRSTSYGYVSAITLEVHLKRLVT